MIWMKMMKSLGFSLVLCSACGPRFHTASSSSDAGVLVDSDVFESDAGRILVPSIGGSSSVEALTGGATSASTSDIAGQSSVAGSSSTGGFSATGGSSSFSSTTTVVSPTTGGQTFVSSSTGGMSAATGGTSYVGVSISVPATTVTYVVRYTIEDPKVVWPQFQLTYFNRANMAATKQTLACLEWSGGNGVECRITVNQALSWELNACVNAECTQTVPRMDASGAMAPMSGVRIFRVQDQSLIELPFGAVVSQTGDNYNFIIQPGGNRLAGTLDTDGDGVTDTADLYPYNPTQRPRKLPSDREICGNDLDEDCDGLYDSTDCATIATPANTGTVTATSRTEVHWLIPNETGASFVLPRLEEEMKSYAKLMEQEPTYQTWPCQPATVADFVTGDFVQGFKCSVERDPAKEFTYQAKVGTLYLAGYVNTCEKDPLPGCEHSLTHSFRDYVTVGTYDFAALDDGWAGFTRSIVLSYVSNGDTVSAVVPMQ
jgi:hypothetical protein